MTPYPNTTRIAALFVAFFLILAFAIPVQGASAPKPIPVISGLKGLYDIGMDSAGNLFYATSCNPSCDVSDLYTLPVGSSTPIHLYSDGTDSVTSSYFEYLSFAGNGNVYFLDVQYVYSESQTDYSLVMLSRATGYAPSVLYSAAFSGQLGTGTQVYSLAVNPKGDVALGVTQFGTEMVGQVLFLAHSVRPAKVIADFGPGSGSPPVAVSAQGVVYAGTGTTTMTEIMRDGSKVVMSNAGNGVGYLLLDGVGNLFTISRSFTNRHCTGWADDTMYTVTEFTRGTLGTSNPTGLTLGVMTGPGYLWWVVGQNGKVALSGPYLFLAILPQTEPVCGLYHLNGEILRFNVETATTDTLAYESVPLGQSSSGASLASFGNALYYSFLDTGTIYRIHQ
jgi:hypothetical protein